MTHRRSVLYVAAIGVGLAALALTATRIVRAESTAPTTGDVEVAAPTTTNATAIPTTTATSTVTDHHQKRLDEMASILGMSATDLQNELQSGKEFYQIAAEHGVTYDKLKAQGGAQFKARLDDMVRVGYLTQDEANTMLPQYQTQEQQMPMAGMFGGWGRHHGFGF